MTDWRGRETFLSPCVPRCPTTRAIRARRGSLQKLQEQRRSGRAKAIIKDGERTEITSAFFISAAQHLISLGSPSRRHLCSELSCLRVFLLCTCFCAMLNSALCFLYGDVSRSMEVLARLAAEDFRSLSTSSCGCLMPSSHCDVVPMVLALSWPREGLTSYQFLFVCLLLQRRPFILWVAEEKVVPDPPQKCFPKPVFPFSLLSYTFSLSRCPKQSATISLSEAKVIFFSFLDLSLCSVVLSHLVFRCQTRKLSAINFTDVTWWNGDTKRKFCSVED